MVRDFLEEAEQFFFIGIHVKLSQRHDEVSNWVYASDCVCLYKLHFLLQREPLVLTPRHWRQLSAVEVLHLF